MKVQLTNIFMNGDKESASFDLKAARFNLSIPNNHADFKLIGLDYTL